MGWRALTDKPVAFAFGHGLSYTSFAYDFVRPPAVTVTLYAPWQRGDRPVLTIHARVRNTGAVAGADVAQLYLAYPQDAGEPPLVLRGFRKTTSLEPGASADVVFGLTARDLSTWNATAGSGGGMWRVALGRFVASVGSSSRNITLSHAFEVKCGGVDSGEGAC